MQFYKNSHMISSRGEEGGVVLTRTCVRPQGYQIGKDLFQVFESNMMRGANRYWILVSVCPAGEKSLARQLRTLDSFLTYPESSIQDPASLRVPAPSSSRAGSDGGSPSQMRDLRAISK
jgi:hypothetical protein